VAVTFSGYSGTNGKGGNNTAAGSNGIVIIRYLGGQRGSGGTVTQDSLYTYHTFSTPGTSSFTA